MCFKWSSRARSQNVPILGSLVKSKALEIAQKLNVANFRASNGALEKWRNRHAISFQCISGESANVNRNYVNQFRNKLSALLQAWVTQDIMFALI